LRSRGLEVLPRIAAAAQEENGKKRRNREEVAEWPEGRRGAVSCGLGDGNEGSYIE